MMWIRIQIQIRGGGSSAKNVHPPWQNPRYVSVTVQKLY